jgi:hypothetical protein
MNSIEVVNNYTQVVCVNTGTSFEDGYTSKIIRSKTNVPQPDIAYSKIYFADYIGFNWEQADERSRIEK